MELELPDSTDQQQHPMEGVGVQWLSGLLVSQASSQQQISIRCLVCARARFTVCSPIPVLAGQSSCMPACSTHPCLPGSVVADRRGHSNRTGGRRLLFVFGWRADSLWFVTSHSFVAIKLHAAHTHACLV
jgi:hypothetical protein